MYSDLYFFCTPFDKLLFKGICSFYLFLFRYYWHLIYIFASAQHYPNHNHNMSRKHLLPYIVTKILFLVVKIFKVYILHNFQIYDVVLLTIFHHALHYTPLPNYAITRSLYILTPSPISSTQYVPPPTSGNPQNYSLYP